VLIVTGSVTARPDTLDELVAISLEHVRRSRTEPGCLLHSVLRDVEDELRLVFLEHWADADALRAHFAVPASNDFVRQARGLSASATSIEIFEATAASV
jgi:quinol monooxygenase YgiN